MGTRDYKGLVYCVVLFLGCIVALVLIAMIKDSFDLSKHAS